MNESRANRSFDRMCYACSETATNVCRGCGALSCVSHVEQTNVVAGKYRGSRKELRCEKCALLSFLGSALLVLVLVAACVCGWIFQ